MEQPAEQKPSNARRIADLCSVSFMCVCILAYLVLCIVFAGQAESIGAMLVLLLLWLIKISFSGRSAMEVSSFNC